MPGAIPWGGKVTTLFPSPQFVKPDIGSRPGFRPVLRISSPTALLLALAVLLLAAVACTPGRIIGYGSGWNSVAYSDGVVYVGGKDNFVAALDASTGRLLEGAGEGDVQGRWFRELPDSHGVFGPPAVGEKLVYFADRGSREGEESSLLALDRETGARRWEKTVGEGKTLVGGPALGDGLVIVGSEDGIVYAFQQEDGAATWHFPTGGRVWSTPTAANGQVYFGSMDGNLYAVATIGERAGKKIWSFDTGAAVVSQPLVLDDMIVFGALNKKFYGLDLEGNLLWTFEGDDWFWAAPVGVDGVVYASTMSGRVYALDSEGNELWPRPFNAGSPIVSRPALLDNRLVVGTDEGRLFLLDSSDGTNVHDTPKLDGRIKADLTVQQDSDDDKVFVFLGLDDSTVRRFEVRADVDLLEPDWVFKP